MYIKKSHDLSTNVGGGYLGWADKEKPMIREKSGIGVFLAVLFLLPPGVLSQRAVTAKRILINAEKGWQDSGVVLSQGQYYEVRAWGAWISGFGTIIQGPEGDGSGTIIGDALVGFISDQAPKILDRDSFTMDIVGKIIYIGRGGLLRVQNPGRLWLAMGEWSGCKECSGSVEVLILVYD